MQVSQKQAARSAEQGRRKAHESSEQVQPAASPWQPQQRQPHQPQQYQQQQRQQQQQQQHLESRDAQQEGDWSDGCGKGTQQQVQTEHHAQQVQDHSRIGTARGGAEGQVLSTVGRGMKANSGDGVASALASDVPAACQANQPQQVLLIRATTSESLA